MKQNEMNVRQGQILLMTVGLEVTFMLVIFGQYKIKVK